ncbi:hypothetical protein PV377_21240 [Streptomyces ipomoeae]|uniref:hypothetical protein n=1 Tax=Streptomyces ipomoeae TaxID=103232 RepID=UPI0029A34479|nr:hypothetical protein [Streptomyces ipomoeae]MDX2841466.1 hypothetical protein [Streptomyces ipomoeae]
MNDRPYTDDDLRAEAARQHAGLTEDPDFMGVGEGMEDRYVQSTVTDPDSEIERTGSTWGELLPYNHDDGNAYNQAQRAIHKLISRAADLSGWAVDMGADGLEPADDCLSLKGDGKPIVRIHFAFAPTVPDDVRQHLIGGVAQAIDAEL